MILIFSNNVSRKIFADNVFGESKIIADRSTNSIAQLCSKSTSLAEVWLSMSLGNVEQDIVKLLQSFSTFLHKGQNISLGNHVSDSAE